MNKILTLTLNPSLDATIVTNHLNVGYYNHVVEGKHLDASGRGVNVSRALSRLNTPTHAFVVLGDDAVSRAYRGLIDNEKFESTIVHYPGRTRSDTIILDQSEKTETHIIDEDSIGPRNDIKTLSASINKLIETDDFVVLAGTLPRESSSDVYARLSQALHEQGVKVVLMTGGDPLKRALITKPTIVTLTQLEAETLLNYPVRTPGDVISAARRIKENGCEQVLIAMSDYSGAALVVDEQAYFATIEETRFDGTDSGVVDAFLAGYLTGLSKGDTIENALLTGASALYFSALQIGNEFGTVDQIDAVRPRVKVETVNTENASNR